MEEVEACNKAAVQSCHGVLNLLSKQSNDPKSIIIETRETLVKFKRVTSLLSRGLTLGQRKIKKLNKFNTTLFPQHIFLESPICIPVLAPKPLQIVPPLLMLNQKISAEKSFLELKPPRPPIYSLKFDGSCYSPSVSNGSRSFVSSLSMDGSVMDNDRNSFHLIGLSQGSDHSSCSGSLKCGSRSKCHCSKKRCCCCFFIPLLIYKVFCFFFYRKLRVRRSIKVPAISNKIADIPSDEYSWRKYGQKPIKGSPHPRGYYKCSSVRGCPARKHVERCVDETSMLIVTYQGDHNHSRILSSQSAQI